MSAIGASFFDQAAFADAAANALGIVTTYSLRWTIGARVGAQAELIGNIGTGAATSPVATYVGDPIVIVLL